MKRKMLAPLAIIGLLVLILACDSRFSDPMFPPCTPWCKTP